MSTCNPAVLQDGSNIDDAPPAKTYPLVCNRAYADVQDFDQDLVATCQRHTRCSTAYCLRTRHGRQECCFGYLKPLQPHTYVVMEEKPTLLTARNDGMVNSFNPVQLSVWRANVDMRYIVSRRKVIEYCTTRVERCVRFRVTRAEVAVPRAIALYHVISCSSTRTDQVARNLAVYRAIVINTSASRRLHLLLPCAFTFTRGVSKYGSSAVSCFRR